VLPTGAGPPAKVQLAVQQHGGEPVHRPPGRLHQARLGGRCTLGKSVFGESKTI
jgi:hypothetical protein